jgi:hypothetical protein
LKTGVLQGSAIFEASLIHEISGARSQEFTRNADPRRLKITNALASLIAARKISQKISESELHRIGEERRNVSQIEVRHYAEERSWLARLKLPFINL